MNHYDAKVFGDNVRGVFDALGGRAPGDKGLEVWFHALKQFPMEHVTDALDEWTRRQNRAPTPAGIADLCYERGIRNREVETAKWREEEKLAPQTMGATPEGRKAIGLLRTAMAKATRKDPRDWARKIVDRYVDRDSSLNHHAFKCACEALDMRAEDVKGLRQIRDRKQAA